MAVFGFGKKDDADVPKPPPQQPTTPPTDRVIAMRQQGLSNNQIIQNLQNGGYDSNLIFDALNQADIKRGVETAPSGNDFSPDDLQNPMQFPSQDSQFPAPELRSPNMQQQGLPPMDMAPSMDQPGSIDPSSMDRIEEIAEAIIDEKWNEIVKSINKIIDWKDRTESKMTKIEQEIADLKQSFDSLTKGVLGKVGEYDQNLSNIGSEIKAMEGVFQKVLPRLTENVHTLERLAKDMKGKKK